jgi:beta-galactosidase
VQMYNGRAIIRVKTEGGKCSVAVKSDGIPTTVINL